MLYILRINSQIPIIISDGINFATMRWTKQTGPGVETGSLRPASNSAHRATFFLLEARGNLTIRFRCSVSFAFSINSVSFIQYEQTAVTEMPQGNNSHRNALL